MYLFRRCAVFFLIVECLMASELDFWLYYSCDGRVEIVNNGVAVKFNPEVGDGAFDGRYPANPACRLVLLDSNLKLSDVSAVIAYWRSIAPRIPTEFIAISNEHKSYRLIFSFDEFVPPPAYSAEMNHVMEQMRLYIKPKNRS